MPEFPQFPRLADIESPAVDALLEGLSGERRVARERHAHIGRYGDLIRLWSAQGELVRARWAKESAARRLEFAKGQALRELADSEFFASLPSDPRKALGNVTVSRTVTNATASGVGTFTAAEIKAGHRFRLPPSPTSKPPVQEATYETVEATVFNRDDSTTVALGGGQYAHTQSATIRVRATREGPHANTPIYDDASYTAQSIDALPTSTPAFTVGAIQAAGGTLGVVDEQLAAFARAMSLGRQAPTDQAAIAGTLANPGARHVAYSTDYTTAIGRLFTADETWAWSPYFHELLLQELYDFPWAGFGCRPGYYPITNRRIVVAATVVLRGKEYEASRTTIAAVILKKLRAYFDERPDWWTWNTDAVGGIIASADRRILTCTAAEVRDFERNVLTEPSALIADGTPELTHYALVGDALDLTFTTAG